MEKAGGGMSRWMEGVGDRGMVRRGGRDGLEGEVGMTEALPGA